ESMSNQKVKGLTTHILTRTLGRIASAGLFAGFASFRMIRVTGIRELRKELAAKADPERARNFAWFFKTAKGQYGEGDRFIGVTVPVQRQIARRYRHLPLDEIAKLLASRTHEHRFTALEILVLQFEKGDADTKAAIFDFYMKNAQRANNWDLVDRSAPYIAGDYLVSRPRDILYRFAKSTNLW